MIDMRMDGTILLNWVRRKPSKKSVGLLPGRNYRANRLEATYTVTLTRRGMQASTATGATPTWSMTKTLKQAIAAQMKCSNVVARASAILPKTTKTPLFLQSKGVTKELMS